MNKMNLVGEFVLKEYEQAQKLTYHLDDLRSRITQFYLVFLGFAMTSLGVIAKGESILDSTLLINGAGIVFLFVGIIGSILVVLCARLRSVQLEHFRIINNVRIHTLKKHVRFRRAIELNQDTLPPIVSRSSGSYYWLLLILLPTSIMYVAAAFSFMYSLNFSCHAKTSIVLLIFCLLLLFHDKFYFVLSAPREPSN